MGANDLLDARNIRNSCDFRAGFTGVISLEITQVPRGNRMYLYNAFCEREGDEKSDQEHLELTTVCALLLHTFFFIFLVFFSRHVPRIFFYTYSIFLRISIYVSGSSRFD